MNKSLCQRIVALVTALPFAASATFGQVDSEQGDSRMLRERIRESLLSQSRSDSREWLRSASAWGNVPDGESLSSVGDVSIRGSGRDTVVAAWVAEEAGYGNAIALDRQGNVYIVGGAGKYMTIKYDAAGLIQWKVGFALGKEARDVAIGPEGGVYVTGYGGHGNDDRFITIKYDAEGVERWISPHHERLEFANALALDYLGNVIVTGWSGANYATLKYGSPGGLLWLAAYDGGLADDPSAVVVDAGRNTYVTGYSERSGEYGADFATIKYGPRGTQLWVSRYAGITGGWNAASSLAIDQFGNVYAAGKSASADVYDYALVKYDSLGTEQWAERYDGGGYDLNPRIVVDESGNVFLSGSSGYSTAEDFVTVKYSSNGERQWVARYNGPANGSDIVCAIDVDEAGNVYVSGSSEGAGTEYDFVTLKYDSFGALQWTARYNRKGRFYDCATDMAIDEQGCVYVTGYSILGGKSFFTTIKYNQISSSAGLHRATESLLAGVPQKPSLSQSYPNPFNPTTTILYTVESRGPVSLSIYDLLGREIATLVNGLQEPGTHRIVWDATGKPSGLYFYRLREENRVETKRLLLLK